LIWKIFHFEFENVGKQPKLKKLKDGAKSNSAVSVLIPLLMIRCFFFE
jgi:hypothetical protein